jgi:hypothetical protein
MRGGAPRSSGANQSWDAFPAGRVEKTTSYLAAKQHDKEATRQRDLLAAKLSPDDVAKAEASASSWKPKSAVIQNPKLVH